MRLATGAKNIISCVYSRIEGISEGAKRSVFTRFLPIFGGSGVSKALPLKDSQITRVPQEVQGIKRAKAGGSLK